MPSGNWRKRYVRGSRRSKSVPTNRPRYRSLRDEEEQARITERRDDVRSRLSAMLYGVEVSAESQPSESADAVKARVDAFRELKGMIDEQRLEDGRNTSKWLRGKRFQ